MHARALCCVCVRRSADGFMLSINKKANPSAANPQSTKTYSNPKCTRFSSLQLQLRFQEKESLCGPKKKNPSEKCCLTTSVSWQLNCENSLFCLGQRIGMQHLWMPRWIERFKIKSSRNRGRHRYTSFGFFWHVYHAFNLCYSEKTLPGLSLSATFVVWFSLLNAPHYFFQCQKIGTVCLVPQQNLQNINSWGLGIAAALLFC